MGITDELRELIEDPLLGYASQDQHIETLTKIADRIDIAHKHAIGYVDDRDPDTMAENGWVRLPKDADGEYIHFGDVMQMLDDNELREVVGFYEEGFLAWLNGRYVPCKARFYGHYHAPTVEDVLREFARECLTYATCVDDHEVQDAIEMYAAKLRLAGDAS